MIVWSSLIKNMLDLFVSNKISNMTSRVKVDIPNSSSTLNQLDLNFGSEKKFAKQLANMIKNDILNNVTDIYKNKIISIGPQHFKDFENLIKISAIRSNLTGKTKYLVFGITLGLSLLLPQCIMESTFVPGGVGVTNMILTGGKGVMVEVPISNDPLSFIRNLSSIIQLQLTQVTGVINYVTPNGTPLVLSWVGLK